MKIKTLFVSLAVAGGLGIGLLGSSSAYAEKCHVTATYVNAVPAKNQPTPLKFASYLVGPA